MATWKNLADSALDPDAPLTSELAYAWRDNPIAITEGAAGAPRIQYAAIQTPSVGNAVVVTSLPNLSITAGSTLVRLRFSTLIAGTARFTVTSFSSTGGSLALVRVRNGVTTTINSFVATGVHDFTMIYGDSYYVEQRAPTDTTSAAFNLSHNGNSPAIIVTTG